MTIQKKPRNSVAIGVGVLCTILLIAIAAIYIDYSSMVTDKSSQISNLQTWLNGNQTALATANSQITSLNATISSLNTQIATLTSQLATANSQISNLQTWLNGNQTALATANSQITSLNATISSLNTQIATLTSQLATANSQITSLQNQVNSLTVEQVRDTTMIYIEAHHNETAQYMQSFSWTGGDITPEGFTGGQLYSYQSAGWNVTIQYPVGLPPGSITTYSVTATYTSQVAHGAVIVSWQGTLQSGIITETAYTFNP